MRRFVVVGHRCVTGDFPLNDITGGGGRLDVLLRCINSAFFLSHGLRTDVELFLILGGPPDPPKTVRMVGSELRGLNPDERSAAGFLKKALGIRLPRGLEKPVSEGIYVSRLDLEGVLRGLGPTRVLYLHEEGEDVRGSELEPDGTFILGDDVGLVKEDEELLEGCKKISLGPSILHSHHCITIIHNELDRRG